MGFKTFTSAVLTSSDVNAFLMKQAVIVATSVTRPGSPVTGMLVYETDTDLFRYYNGTLWRAISTAGSVSATTSAGGTIAGTAHNLGTTPSYIGVQYTSAPNQAIAIRVSAKSSTTFDVNIRDCSGGLPLASVAVAFDWIAR